MLGPSEGPEVAKAGMGSGAYEARALRRDVAGTGRAGSTGEAPENDEAGLMVLGRREDDLAAYHGALALRPEYAEAHNNLGNALKELGLPEEAAASYGKALAFKPDYPAAYSNLGVALKEQGKLEEAVAAYRKALAIAPDYAEALYNLCEVYEKTNRTEDLRETLISARQNCPEDPRFSLREAQLLKRDGALAAARAVLEAPATAGGGGSRGGRQVHPPARGLQVGGGGPEPRRHHQ